MSTLGELRAALELALDWYEPKHDDVVPRWVVLARVALVADEQGAPDFAALPYKLTVDLSNYLENHRDCLPKTIALRRDIEFIVKVAMKEVAERAAAPSLHKEGETVEDGFGSVWMKACPEQGCPGDMQVMRPGKVQCSHEHLHEKLLARGLKMPTTDELVFCIRSLLPIAHLSCQDDDLKPSPEECTDGACAHAKDLLRRAALHKEGAPELQARFTRALANNNILEQMILANWKAGSNPANSININGLINDLVDVLGEVMGHKEGAGGECPYKKQHNVGYRCPHCGAIEPLPLQRTLPDEQFKGVVVEPIGTQGEAETMLKFREYSQWTEEQSAWLARKWRKAGDESNKRKTARAYFNCAQDIEEFFRAAASPAGRAEQAAKDGEN